MGCARRATPIRRITQFSNAPTATPKRKRTTIMAACGIMCMPVRTVISVTRPEMVVKQKRGDKFSWRSGEGATE